MVEQREHIHQDRVISEINSTLTEACQDLEQYANSTNDLTLLESCRTKVQKIHDILKVSKQKGAQLFTREILLLLDTLKGIPIENAQEQRTMLIQAILQLPGYLAHTSRSGKDSPNLLKRLLNEMRQLRGQRALSDIDFFTPSIVHTIAPIPEDQLQKLQASDFAVLIRKIRQKYQLCLAGVLRGNQQEQQVTAIRKIFAKLQNLCWDSPISPLWDACTAFSEGLKEGSIAIDNHAITILREMDHELKCLATEETNRLNTNPSEELLREILYRIGKANSDNTLILSIKHRYSLEEALESESEDINLINFDAAAPVAKTIKEALTHVKDALNSYHLNPDANKSRLQDQLTTCQQISDTLGTLGLNHLQSVMQNESRHLQTLLNSDQPSEQAHDVLMNTAAQLLGIEAGLNQFMGLSSSMTGHPSVSAQMDDTHHTTIHEAKKNLEQTKRALSNYLGSQHNLELLAKLIPPLKSIQGSLAIIPLNRATELISRCSQYIQNQWLDKNFKPGLDELEALADTLSSIECYLEQLSVGTSAYSERMLDTTQESLDKLESLWAANVEPKASTITTPSEPNIKFKTLSTHMLSDEEKATLRKDAYKQKLDHGPVIKFSANSQTASKDITKEQSLSFPPSIDITNIEILLPDTASVGRAEMEADEQPLTTDFSLKEDEPPPLDDLSLIEESTTTNSTASFSNSASEINGKAGKVHGITKDVTQSIIFSKNYSFSLDETFNISLGKNSNDNPRKIFVKEAIEVQQQLKSRLPAWRSNTNDEIITNEIQKAFHTLKSSGQMIGANVIGELAWSVENMISSVIKGSIPISEPIAELIGEIISMLPELVNDFAKDNQQLTPEVLLCMEKADTLGKGISFTIDSDDPEDIDPQEPSIMFGNIMEERAEEGQDNPAREQLEPRETKVADKSDKKEQPGDLKDGYDQQLLEIFDSEARGHLSVIKEFIKNGHQFSGDIQITDTLQRALHTLKGSAFMAEIIPLAELITAIEKLIKELRAHLVPADNQVISMLEQGVDLIENALLQLQTTPQSLELKVDSFLDRLNTLHNQLLNSRLQDQPETKCQPEKQATGQQTALFLTRDLDLLLNAGNYLNAWIYNMPLKELDQLKLELQALARNTNEAGLSTIAELCYILRDVCVYLETCEDKLPLRLLLPLTNGFEALVEMMNQVASQQTPKYPKTVFSALSDVLESLFPGPVSSKVEPSTTELDNYSNQSSKSGSFEFIPNADAEKEIVLSSISNEHFEPLEAKFSDTITSAEKQSLVSFVNENESDQELRKVFIDEAYGLLEESSQSLEIWLRTPDELQPVYELQRCLHTLKGGAMMAELKELGGVIHALEDVYESITNGSCEPENAPLGLIQKTHDTIEEMLKALDIGCPSPNLQRMQEELRQWKHRLNSSDSPTTSIDALPDYLGQTTVTEPVSHELPESEGVINDLSERPLLKQHSELVLEPISTINAASQNATDIKESAPQSASSGMIRISPELLETLINLAGETSINRSRVEQQTADSSKTLEEMSRTIFRIREQLKRLDIKAQTQIIPQHQDDLDNNPDFDPLEIDRYSELSQLSHSLIESTSDLMDLREAIQEKTRNTETLLLQQSRTQIELQGQLMKARMVSFNHVVPRLRKIVQQVSNELNKPVELLVSNAEEEMDKTILDRIQPSLEHILRNAIDHGIEDTVEERRNSGKPEAGQISLSIRQDGADIVVELSDDGRGINIEAVKAKAVEQNLINSDEHISDQEAIELIIKSGFSTASNVTHLSGRGVGLDVVYNSVRQLGGSVQVSSETGQGAQFSLRLPFTLSITRALIVELDNSLYALPMHAIDGVTKVSSTVLIDCYKSNTPLIYDNGTKHQLIYMGDLIGTDTPRKISDEQYPVVLVQRGRENIAIQVDSIVGSREIITKSLGIQFSGLIGVNGATILGDGRVVVILDPATLCRKHLIAKPSSVERNEFDSNNHAVKVLVVDDSVTVRKVTRRFLVRQGYEVSSARDGVEAMTMLSEHKPDIMLLDIEMPHMDGFEVARAVRNDPKLQNLPIIMITSRTGEKHRNQAFNLGINEYIGKPFQEGPLLEAIEKLIKIETAT